MTLASVIFRYDSKDIDNKRGNRKIELSEEKKNACPKTDSIIRSHRKC